MTPAPPIDRRTAVDVARQLRTLLATYVPDWKGDEGDFGTALVSIFARFAEIAIERINRTPDKNLLAYLDLLGIALLPPQPARVPLTFSLAAGSASDGVVPAATQVAAPPAEGETVPLIFETERELVVIAATLDRIFARDPGSDRFADLADLTSATASGAQRAFTGSAPIDHDLYIGLDYLLGRNDLGELTLQFDIACDPPPSDPPPLDKREVSWSIVDLTGARPIAPKSDGTEGLARSGPIVFTNLKAVARQSVHGLTSRWLRGRLTTPIGPGGVGHVRAAHLPEVRKIHVSAVVGERGLPIDRGFTNAAPVDTTRDFFPFGERPRPGDALYLSAGDAFATSGAQVTVNIKPSEGSAPVLEGNPKLSWEFWNGRSWGPPGEKLNDETAALSKKPGKVTFRNHSRPVAVNGIDGHWIRVRIASGNYGNDATYVPDDANDLAKGYRYVPATLSPPLLAAVSVDYEAKWAGRRPECILICNDLGHAEISPGTSFRPFVATEDIVPTLYLGFTLPSSRAFPNRPVALYLGIAEPASGAKPDNPSPTGPPRLVWECSEGAGAWRRPGLRDGTLGLTRPGVVEFLPPPTFAQQQEFGAERYWLRCRLEAGGFDFEPQLQRVLLNTVMATHASTIRDETLGSSDGSQNQRYATERRPVLDDAVELRVREPDLPSADERAALEAAGGGEPTMVTLAAGGRPAEIWVRWHEVPDFYGSGPRDRHYVLDHLTAAVSFGDGVNGLVPPLGTGNLRLARYRTGGGSAGNQAAGTIVQLRTTIPYVDRVANLEPARGGVDAETMDSLRERGPRAIRHRDRAVTIEDYEDLALLASPEVARAKCVPLSDLSASADATVKSSGKVSVIVVPRSTQAKPLPSRVLLERVADYLDARRLPVVELKVVSPDYVGVNITAEVALTSIDRAAEVQPRIVESLGRFLHPLSGGFDGAGWDFGRIPHRSDLLRRIGETAGVDHVRSLIFEPPEQQGTTISWALLHAGTLNITVVAANA